MRSFQEFLCAAAYVFITDTEFQSTANAAGLDWFDLPETLDSVKAARRYLAERASKPHSAVLFAMKGDLRFLEMGAPNFRCLPNDAVALGYELRAQRERFEYQELGQRLLADPERGRFHLDTFSPDSSSGVQSAALEDLLPFELIAHRARVKANEAITIVDGFEMLCAATECCNPEHLTGVLGSTGFGKTNFGMNLALRFARKHLVGYVNMEMGYADMIKRTVVIGTHTTFEEYRRGLIDDGKVNAFLDRVRGRFQMTSGAPLSFPMIEAWARGLAKQGMKMLVVDYDQKIELPADRNTPEWKALQKAMYALESLAKGLKIAVMVFAQVNRDGEISGSHRSQFSVDTMISFERHPIHGPVLWAKKNRHGYQNAAIRVDYQQSTATITEIESIIIDPNQREPSMKAEPKLVQVRTQAHYNPGAKHD
jgi:KaiC/GvpD/RAD55 family RecA-like ATPase